MLAFELPKNLNTETAAKKLIDLVFVDRARGVCHEITEQPCRALGRDWISNLLAVRRDERCFTALAPYSSPSLLL
jgi:hypothetical protein